VFLLSKGLELLFPGKTGFVEAQHRWWTILIRWYVANGLMLVGTCQSQPSTLWILALIYFVLEFLLTCLYMVTSGPGGCSSGCLVMVSRWLHVEAFFFPSLSPFFFFLRVGDEANLRLSWGQPSLPLSLGVTLNYLTLPR
jgi:phosphatidylglycerophosphate synthase